SGCRRTGVVCGIDGNTYSSECAAVARNVLVDYPGPCLAVGLIDTQAKQQCSSPVICPPLASPGCLGVTPPGACCPVCAGAIRVLYSQKQVDRALYALKSTQAIRALTLQAVLRALDRHVTVAECTVRGHLTVELDILVLVVPVRPAPSLLQLQACVSEAEKLSNLVRLASPKLVSELSVGTLTAARVVHNVVVSGGKALWPTPSLALTPALFLLLRLVAVVEVFQRYVSTAVPAVSTPLHGCCSASPDVACLCHFVLHHIYTSHYTVSPETNNAMEARRAELVTKHDEEIILNAAV
ncbi:hypothetical protein J6590_098182, partial [Homalodisca vitripennis]